MKRFGVIILAAAALCSSSYGAPLSDPLVDAYNVRVGTETFAALYKFTTNTVLVETAQAITNMGSDTIKLYLGANTSFQSGLPLPPNVTNLLTLVRDEPSYHKVFDLPFRHFIMWTYPLGNSDEWWGSGYKAAQGAKDYQEMYDLTHYLLTNYNNSGKTFYLGHWEGDGYLRVNNWSTNPSMTTVQGMIGWLNNRQKAVDDAKRDTPCTNVYVYNYAECNRVRDAMLNNSNNNVRVINYVIPYVTNLDYLSYSSYDSQNLSASDLYTTLDYMESKLPGNKAASIPGARIWIGEYGWGSKSVAAQEPLNRAYIQRLLGWNWNGHSLPFLLFWEMYSNFNDNGGTNFCLIDYAGNRVPSWYLQHYYFNAARMLTAQFKETNGRLPTDTEFSSMVVPLLDQPLSAPIELALTNGGAVLSSNASATVSGTLAQGVYGDSEAGVWVFYGRHDGGTSVGGWENSRYLGVNTNFNPRTFSVTLSGLAPQTNYFYRFFASNFATNTWAPASAQFSTETLNASSFGSKMKIFFSGYDRDETLTNFPVSVTFGPDLPGFSYSQFASASGGDLRFADSSGVLPIPFEIDEWNTNGNSTVWVNVPALSRTNNFVWAYWGNPLSPSLPPSATDGSAWPDFDFVWHLKESGFPYEDSALRSPALTGIAPTVTDGMFGHGELFGGSQFLNAGAVSLGPEFTLSAWVKLDPSANNIQTILANKPGGWNSPGFALYANSYNTTDGKLILETGDGTKGFNASTGTGVITTGQWHYIVAAVDETNGLAQLYVDGVNRTGNATIDSAFPNQMPVNLGRMTNNVYYFKGLVDEVRIHGGCDSSNWVSASWSDLSPNQNLASYSAIVRQEPTLDIDAAGEAGAVVSWPATAVGYALYTTTNLSLPEAWTLAPSQPALVNGQWQISLAGDTNAGRFYRLESQ